MFITIKYGSREEQLFNPDCSLIQLVNDIRNRCHCPRGAGVALIETDRRGSVCGDVIELKEESLDNGAELFTLRAEYVLLAIYKRESGNSKYVSLMEDISQELALKLDTLSNPKAGESKHSKNWSKAHQHTKKQSKASLFHQSSSSTTTSKGKRTTSRGGRGKT